jgi:integrase
MASLYKRGDIYWIKKYIPGTKNKYDRISTKTGDLKEAKRQLKVIEGEEADGKSVSLTARTVKFEQLLDLVYDDWEENGMKPENIKREVRRIKNHIWDVFAHLNAASITDLDIKNFKRKRRLEGASPATIRRDLEHLSHAFDCGLKIYKILGPTIELPDVRNPKQGFFEAVEYDGVLAYLPAHYVPFVRFGKLTGWRSGEIKNLRRRHVDFVNREIRLDFGTTKNGEGRVFPMSEELEELLREVIPAKGFPEDYVFTYTVRDSEGRPYIAHSRRKDPETGEWVVHTLPATRPVGDFRKAWRTACNKAGIQCETEPWSYVNPKNGKRVHGERVLGSSRTMHDFRRTAARDFLDADIDEQVAMELTGHKTRAVFRDYRIVSKKDKLAAIAKLDAARRDAADPGTATPETGTIPGTIPQLPKSK